jgi:hypothetical protein
VVESPKKGKKRKLISTHDLAPKMGAIVWGNRPKKGPEMEAEIFWTFGRKNRHAQKSWLKKSAPSHGREKWLKIRKSGKSGG